MRLLAINNYDKDEYVNRWLDQVKQLDSTKWLVQVITNGPANRAFDTKTVKCANPPGLGYRTSLLATEVDTASAVVSVHAKTWLPDISLIDRLVNMLHGYDGVFLPRQYFNGAGEFCFMFVMTADAWRMMASTICDESPELFPEIALARAIDRLKLNILRVPAEFKLSAGACHSHWIKNVAGSRMDLYGCEPGRFGFGHYQELDGYRNVSVDERGVVT